LLVTFNVISNTRATSLSPLTVDFFKKIVMDVGLPQKGTSLSILGIRKCSEITESTIFFAYFVQAKGLVVFKIRPVCPL